MTARLTVAAVLLIVQGSLFFLTPNHSLTLTMLCTLYLAATLISRFVLQPQPLGGAINPMWTLLVGVDILVFAALQVTQNPGINYTPLFALPILFASVLGTLTLALGTAASVTLLLMGGSYWNSLQSLTDATPYLVQAALSGAGYFAVAFLAHQLAVRLVLESERARQGQRAANMQKRVNELVIENLPDGVLILDSHGWVRAANPAARDMLEMGPQSSGAMDLKSQPAWSALFELARTSLGTGQPLEEQIRLGRQDRSGRLLRVRTRLAQPLGADGENLCVIFLQDHRELEARLRTEKLASMGRMSAAVAHEIRNPLAAISQANALLSEDLNDPRLLRLSNMVDQNARRLGKIVDDILNVSRVQPHSRSDEPFAELVGVSNCVAQHVAEWLQQNPWRHEIPVERMGEEADIRFENDHLRRILFNLLDNAHRYASATPGAIRVWVDTTSVEEPSVGVWSNGAPLDPSVLQHLFEPFFSSESRSSGLGLFLCRELCAQHGATLVYRRVPAPMSDGTQTGNAFVLMAQRAHASTTGLRHTLSTPWQPTLY
ncbi:histidine kinase dimerization/phospho-acceptor domain-containing protein [Curvibacter sp. APW13]|uniref:sensor histidine kinase n=1 Tax=Curvibacter sp. APW13 TaxID=3077236 RepID=UPI0028DFC108|nr:ATP-binding protein [Curvibacter sp. APW13]MDT8989767.1 histidine kinase dimerization/phospho-acceptor domain-containing protein [Curvibacter sp. APW13]